MHDDAHPVGPIQSSRSRHRVPQLQKSSARLNPDLRHQSITRFVTASFELIRWAAAIRIRFSGWALCVFEQLDDISRRIFKQDLPPCSRFGHFATKACSRFAQPIDHSVEVICHDHESVPPAWFGVAPGYPGTAGSWRIEKKMPILKYQLSEPSGTVLLDREAQALTVKIHRLVDVDRNVSDGCHGSISLQHFTLRPRHLHDAS